MERGCTRQSKSAGTPSRDTVSPRGCSVDRYLRTPQLRSAVYPPGPGQRPGYKRLPCNCVRISLTSDYIDTDLCASRPDTHQGTMSTSSRDPTMSSEFRKSLDSLKTTADADALLSPRQEEVRTLRRKSALLKSRDSRIAELQREVAAIEHVQSILPTSDWGSSRGSSMPTSSRAAKTAARKASGKLVLLPAQPSFVPASPARRVV